MDAPAAQSMSASQIRSALELLWQADFVICANGKALYTMDRGAVVPDWRKMMLRERRKRMSATRRYKPPAIRKRARLRQPVYIGPCLLTIPMRFA